MKIEKQVCTLEQAKKLVQLGLYAPSAFLYFKATSHAGIVLGDGYKRQIWIVTGVPYDDEEINITPAYTAAELIKMNGGNSGIETGATKEDKGKFYMQTGGFGEDNKPVFTFYESFAEASAAKLINALENEWLDVETCNSRLLE